MYGSLDISVSGMVAQRTRMNTIAANIANADAILDPNGDPNPYRRRITMFAPGAADGSERGGVGRPRAHGVRVQEIALDPSPFRKVYDPTHPLAAKETDPERDLVAGYVNFPNIDTTIEQINAISAARSYEANLAAAEASKTMMAQALQLIA